MAHPNQYTVFQSRLEENEDNYNIVSTCAATVNYSYLRRILTIEFHQRGTYEYSGVGPQVAWQASIAPSFGQFFNARIRPNYIGVRIA